MIDMPPVAPQVQEAQAQSRFECGGEFITAINFRRHRPATEHPAQEALEAASEAAGLTRSRTNVDVLRSYMRLKVGGQCTEADRRESERLLRAQKFVASATVTARRVAPGRVLIRVDIVDEWPYVLGGTVQGLRPTSVRLGSVNLKGRGTTAITSFENGRNYRTGYGLQLEQYGLVGRPAFMALTLERRPIGGTIALEASEPFITDRQRNAFHVSLIEETRYVTLARPNGDDAAVRTERAAYDITWITRVGSFGREGMVGLVGAGFMREQSRPGEESVIVSDTGIVSTRDNELTGRYQTYTAERLGLIIGLRALDYLTVTRFSALRAAQDVGRGVQGSLFIAPAVFAGNRMDVLFTGDFYGGVGNEASFVSFRAAGEARGQAVRGPWLGTVISAHVDWHRLPSLRRTRITSLSGAAVGRPVVPSQLTFRDFDGGLIGFPAGREAGGRRIVLRHEERMLTPWLSSRADIAVAAFADVGRIWQGDVPYAATSPIRSSVGISLLGAVRSGKRTYRIDLALPVNPGLGDTRFAIRLGSADRTGRRWMEASDVSRTRAGAGPASLTNW